MSSLAGGAAMEKAERDDAAYQFFCRAGGRSASPARIQQQVRTGISVVPVEPGGRRQLATADDDQRLGLLLMRSRKASRSPCVPLQLEAQGLLKLQAGLLRCCSAGLGGKPGISCRAGAVRQVAQLLHPAEALFIAQDAAALQALQAWRRVLRSSLAVELAQALFDAGFRLGGLIAFEAGLAGRRPASTRPARQRCRQAAQDGDGQGQSVRSRLSASLACASGRSPARTGAVWLFPRRAVAAMRSVLPDSISNGRLLTVTDTPGCRAQAVDEVVKDGQVPGGFGLGQVDRAAQGVISRFHRFLARGRAPGFDPFNDAFESTRLASVQAPGATWQLKAARAGVAGGSAWRGGWSAGAGCRCRHSVAAGAACRGLVAGSSFRLRWPSGTVGVVTQGHGQRRSAWLNKAGCRGGRRARRRSGRGASGQGNDGVGFRRQTVAIGQQWPAGA